MRLAITFWGDRCYRDGYPECKCGCREDGCFTRVLSVHFFGKVGCKDKYKENVKKGDPSVPSGEDLSCVLEGYRI